VFSRHLRRPRLDLVIAHLDGRPAAAAHQVVVMVFGAAPIDRFAGVVAQRVEHPRRCHRLQCPVDGGQADVLAALRETAADVDWFYLSPAASFGSAAPGEATGRYRIGGDVLLTDADGNSNISGADYATAFVDEIEKPAHRRQRFSVAY